MACENGVESSQVTAAFRKVIAPARLDESKVVFLQTCVDRICTRLDSLVVREHEWLVVDAEAHARWHIEDQDDIERLKEALVPLDEIVSFTEFVAQHRIRKVSVTNGAHALLALHCWYLGIDKTDEYLNGVSFSDKSGSSVSFDSIDKRREFLHQLICLWELVSIWPKIRGTKSSVSERCQMESNIVLRKNWLIAFP
jgi:hypothetical protein